MTLRKDMLRDARVMVVGCGALGNEVLKNLALCGVGHIVCVDFDKVEYGNLSRSVLFRREDAGRLKVDVARERLLELSPDICVTTIDGDIACDIGLGIIRDMDVVVSCVDSRWARFMINRHCMRMGRTWVDGGISTTEGTVRVFAPGSNCYACGLSQDDLTGLRRRISCSNVIKTMEKAGSAPTTSITASIAGAVQAQEAIKVICGEPSICGKVFFYDGDSVNCGTASFTAFDEDCPEHCGWAPVVSTSLTSDATVEQVLSASDACDDTALMLRDDCFVDYIVSRSTDRQYEVMLPGRKVADFVRENLCSGSTGDFYQNEYRVIDRSFPYSGLTLRQLGIPEQDVLQVSIAGKNYYWRLRR